MSTTTRETHRRRSTRRWIPALLLAAPMAFSGIALANPPTACAERIWDYNEYDSCSRNFPPGTENSVESWTEHMKWCCYKSGGDWNDSVSNCQAPPPERAGNAPVVVTPGQVEDPVTPRTPRPSVPKGGIFAPQP